MKELERACDAEFYIKNGELLLDLTNKQVKRGIEYFDNKNRVWV